MKKINVIDLDGTLISYDSSRKYVFHFLKQPGTFFSFFFILSMRILKVYDREVFFKKIVTAARKHKDYQNFTKKLGKEVISDLIPERLKKVEEYSDQDTICILCSASPIDYVKFIADHLGWEVVASQVSENEVIHMHGKQKLISIREQYPEMTYQYFFAMGDSQSDLHLMEMFTEYELVKTK